MKYLQTFVREDQRKVIKKIATAIKSDDTLSTEEQSKMLFSLQLLRKLHKIIPTCKG